MKVSHKIYESPISQTFIFSNGDGPYHTQNFLLKQYKCIARLLHVSKFTRFLHQLSFFFEKRLRGNGRSLKVANAISSDTVSYNASKPQEDYT